VTPAFRSIRFAALWVACVREGRRHRERARLIAALGHHREIA
jgi:hypothetical protein